MATGISQLIECPHCGKEVRARGLHLHILSTHGVKHVKVYQEGGELEENNLDDEETSSSIEEAYRILKADRLSEIYRLIGCMPPEYNRFMKWINDLYVNKPELMREKYKLEYELGRKDRNSQEWYEMKLRQIEIAQRFKNN